MIQQHQTANAPMNVYDMIRRPDGSGFDVHVTGFDGARQTMLSFENGADAEAWIAIDKARDRAEGKPG